MVQQALNIIWMLLTVIFLVLAMYYQRAHFHGEKEKQIEVIAEETRVKIDNLLENTLESAFAIPLYGHDFKDCRGLLPSLRSVSFNSPIISGIVISNLDSKVICSTVGEDFSLPKPTSEGLTLFGPLKMDALKQDSFLLQLKIGEYFLGIYITQTVLKNLIAPTTSEISFIGLYNKVSKKFILESGNAKSVNLSSSDPAKISKVQLQNLDDIEVVLAANPELFKKGFMYHLLIASLIIIGASFFLYFQIRSIINKRFSLIHALGVAIKNNRFQPVYQPIMDCEQNKYCGAEILIRWQMGKDEIMPDLFIEEAEQSGLIVPMTLQILDKVFKESQCFLKSHPEFHFGLNISACHFSDKKFFIEFSKLCEHYGVRPQQIMLELTERELLDQNNKKLIAKMDELRKTGHSLAIDDFGTGHASIKYLQHFPFNYLKIDKIFIHAIGTGAITEHLNQAIIHMGNSLKLDIIAEGVETNEQFMLLRQHQVRFMQGWFFEKAVTFERLIKIIDGTEHE